MVKLFTIDGEKFSSETTLIFQNENGKAKISFDFNDIFSEKPVIIFSHFQEKIIYTFCKGKVVGKDIHTFGVGFFSMIIEFLKKQNQEDKIIYLLKEYEDLKKQEEEKEAKEKEEVEKQNKKEENIKKIMDGEGFTEKKARMIYGRIEKELEKMIKYEGKLYTFAEWYNELLNEGWTLFVDDGEYTIMNKPYGKKLKQCEYLAIKYCI